MAGSCNNNDRSDLLDALSTDPSLCLFARLPDALSADASLCDVAG